MDFSKQFWEFWAIDRLMAGKGNAQKVDQGMTDRITNSNLSEDHTTIVQSIAASVNKGNHKAETTLPSRYKEGPEYTVHLKQLSLFGVLFL